MGRRYDENTIYEIARRITTGEISYREAQLEYGIRSQGSIGPWLKKYRDGLLPYHVMGKYDNYSKEDLVKMLEESEKKLKRSNLQAKGYESLIEVAEQTFGIDIRKKSGTKPFSDSESKK